MLKKLLALFRRRQAAKPREYHVPSGGVSALGVACTLNGRAASAQAPANPAKKPARKPAAKSTTAKRKVSKPAAKPATRKAAPAKRKRKA
jgi:hypothetical protein